MTKQLHLSLLRKKSQGKGLTVQFEMIEKVELVGANDWLREQKTLATGSERTLSFRVQQNYVSN